MIHYSADGLELEDVSQNLGLLPVRLGLAKQVQYYHTLTHYYKLDGVLAQIDAIRSHYGEILRVAETDGEVQKVIHPRVQVMEHMLKTAEERIFESILPRRSKRGLLNGLGSVVKFITGNLDANDEEKYNRIIQHLQTNQEIITQQIAHHYSINDQLINDLNSTIESINYNHDVLASEINSLKELSSFSTHVKQVENALEHNQLLLQLILDLTQDIETSITFCKLKTLHPSIIKPQVLQSTLRKLAPFYNNLIPDFEGESLWEIQSHIKVKCFIGPEEIVYFLDVPIVHPYDYDLLLLQPIPTLLDDTYVTISPSSKYVLKPKTNAELIFSNDPCEPGQYYYLCPNNLHLSNEHNCESDILLKGINGNCDLIQLKMKQNHIEFLTEAKRYVFIFPFEDQIKIITQGNIEFKKLLGIYLVSPENTTIVYRNQTLNTPFSQTMNVPSLVKFVKSSWDLNRRPTVELKLKSLKNIVPPTTPLVSSTQVIVKYLTPSIWTVLLYVMFVGLSCYFIKAYKSYKRELQLAHQ